MTATEELQQPLAMAREFNHERCGCWAPDTAGPEEIANYGD